jgi:hypothetical protein
MDVQVPGSRARPDALEKLETVESTERRLGTACVHERIKHAAEREERYVPVAEAPTGTQMHRDTEAVQGCADEGGG